MPTTATAAAAGPRWVDVERAIRQTTELRAEARLMLLAVASVLDWRTWRGPASMPRIAREGAVCEKTARRWTQRLERLGYVERSDRTGPDGADLAPFWTLRVDRLGVVERPADVSPGEGDNRCPPPPRTTGVPPDLDLPSPTSTPLPPAGEGDGDGGAGLHEDEIGIYRDALAILAAGGFDSEVERTALRARIAGWLRTGAPRNLVLRATTRAVEAGVAEGTDRPAWALASHIVRNPTPDELAETPEPRSATPPATPAPKATTTPETTPRDRRRPRRERPGTEARPDRYGLRVGAHVEPDGPAAAAPEALTEKIARYEAEADELRRQAEGYSLAEDPDGERGRFDLELAEWREEMVFRWLRELDERTERAA